MTKRDPKCTPGCGRCCDPVALPYRWAALRPDQREQIEPANRAWIEDHLTEIMPRRVGLDQVADYMKSGMTTIGSRVDSRVATIVTFFYECDWFDPETRECLAHDQRPPICSGFPWYGERPDPTKAIPPECGYVVDVGREPVPVTIGPRR